MGGGFFYEKKMKGVVKNNFYSSPLVKWKIESGKWKIVFFALNLYYADAYLISN